ncbi:MAG: FG-GAP-like repeat-containing protein [Micrococcales bacterium]|nr:FG-GAP-like repeat-containing protein [Micrococcales bacterium]
MASFVVPVSSPAAPAPHPVKTKVERHALTAASGVPAARTLSAADAAAAQQRADGKRSHVTSASSELAVPSDLAVIGVTWARGGGSGATVQYRQRGASGWSSWAFIDADGQDGPDRPEAAEPGARSGSDPIVVIGASHVQVRLITPVSGAAPAAPEIIVVDPGTSEADRSVGVAQPGSAVAAARRPVIYTRAQWGADESLREQSAPTYGAVNAAFVHHTAGTNNYSSGQVPSILRGIYAFHVNGRGWRDIGYNFLIDRFGRTWEGRYGGMTRAVVGAQAVGMNYDSFGVSVLGNFDIAGVPAAAVSAVKALVGWKAQIHEFNPRGTALINGRRFNAVSGHRDANQTSCPGRYLYAQLPSVRIAAGAAVAGLPSLSIDRDLDNREGGDLLARRANGDLALYSSTNSGRLKAPVVIGRTTDRDLLTIAGDFDGGGSADLVSRRRSDGRLLLQTGDATGNGKPGSARVIGHGWSGMDVITGAGDWDGDGRQDLLARVARTGALRLYSGNGRGGFRASRAIGSGWQGMRLVTGVGDWDADRRPDVLAVHKNGVARIYRGNGAGGFLPAIILPGDWSGYRSVVAVGDANGDTRVDVIGVTAGGTARLGAVGRSVNSVVWSSVPTSLAGLAVYTG